MCVRIRSNFSCPRDGPKDFDREARSLEGLDEVGIRLDMV